MQILQLVGVDIVERCQLHCFLLSPGYLLSSPSPVAGKPPTGVLYSLQLIPMLPLRSWKDRITMEASVRGIEYATEHDR
jgi:hypothetical protein